MNKSESQQQALKELAEVLTEKGYKVYLSLSIHFNYGVYTKPDSDRCVYFQFDIFQGYLFSSVAVPSRDGGTGYRIAEYTDLAHVVNNADHMLKSISPNWVNHTYKYQSIDQYLARSKHSNYELFTTDK